MHREVLRVEYECILFQKRLESPKAADKNQRIQESGRRRERDRRLGAAENQTTLNIIREAALSASTVKRRLVTGGLHGRVAARKPLFEAAKQKQKATEKAVG